MSWVAVGTAAAMWGLQGVTRGIGGMMQAEDVGKAETALGDIRTDQLRLAGESEQLGLDVSQFGMESTLGQAQISYDQLVGTAGIGYKEAGIGYRETMSGLQGQLGDLSMQGTSAYGDIQSQTRARGSGGMAVQSNITTQAQQQKSELLRKYKTGQTQIAESMGYAGEKMGIAGERKNLALGIGKRQLAQTGEAAAQQNIFTGRGLGIQSEEDEIRAEQEYQAGLSGLPTGGFWGAVFG